MSQEVPDAPSGAESRAFFAALLAACREGCKCKTCQILRKVADTMTAEFVEAPTDG